MTLDYQVVVAGGGPAGAWTARQLARHGVRVLLLEAESPAVDVLCSGLLNRESQRALGLDPPQHVRREPWHPQLEFHDTDNRLRRGYDPYYLNTHRPAFDAWLRELAAEAGAEVRFLSRASSLATVEGAAVTRTPQGDIRSAFVVDATGWRGLSRKLAGAARVPQLHAFQGTVRLSLPESAMWAIYCSAVTPFYGWIVPKGAGAFLLGAGFRIGQQSTRDQQANPWAKLDVFADYLRYCGSAVEYLDAKPRGSPIACISSLRDLWWGAGRVFAVGEAAGLVSPSSGDGISYSLQSAAAFARAIAGELHHGTATDGESVRELRKRITARATAELRPALRELKFNCLKARIAASPRWRRRATPLLPLFLRRPVQQLPFGR